MYICTQELEGCKIVEFEFELEYMVYRGSEYVKQNE